MEVNNNTLGKNELLFPKVRFLGTSGYDMEIVGLAAKCLRTCITG